jgi:hypothetical protein
MLCEKSIQFRSLVKNPDEVIPSLESETLQKSAYFSFLAKLKDYKHPYDAKIFNAEQLASKNDFLGADAILMGIILGYNRKKLP